MLLCEVRGSKLDEVGFVKTDAKPVILANRAEILELLGEGLFEQRVQGARGSSTFADQAVEAKVGEALMVSAYFASRSRADRERILSIVMDFTAGRDTSAPDRGACGSGIKATRRALGEGSCHQAEA